jgi:ADP-ribose pyrophosphatase YjhB (NUDIX family)
MGKDRGSSEMDFGIRVGVVVERDGALLLVRHEKPDRDPYWVLPGGRLEPGETIPRCAERELLEETSLEGKFSGVLYVSEFFAEGRHTVDVTARVEVSGGEAQLGSDPEVEEGADPTLKELRWVQTEELERIQLLPGWVRARLSEDASQGWQPNRVYLGSGDA